jgi:hypothetical protein
LTLPSGEAKLEVLLSLLGGFYDAQATRFLTHAMDVDGAIAGGQKKFPGAKKVDQCSASVAQATSTKDRNSY